MFPQYTNPVNDFYFRNAALQQAQFAPQYPQQQLMQNIPQQQNNQVICRYVTNIEEAKAAMVDALSTYIFLDTANGKMYLKRLNNNGLSDFYTYIIEETKNAENKPDPFTEINTRLTNIENSLGELKNESIPGNAGLPKSARNVKAAVTGEDEPNGNGESGTICKNAANDKRQE